MLRRRFYNQALAVFFAAVLRGFDDERQVIGWSISARSWVDKGMDFTPTSKGLLWINGRNA
jgi:hypothetical protein